MKRLIFKTSLEPVECIATVGDHFNPTFSISVHPDPGRDSLCYFKIFNNPDYTSATKLARIDMNSPSYIYHKDRRQNWQLNAKLRKNLVQFMNSESEVYNGSNWQATKFLRNMELHLYSKVKNNSNLKLFDAYVQGYFDDKLSLYPGYVLSYAKMPDYRNLS